MDEDELAARRRPGGRQEELDPPPEVDGVDVEGAAPYDEPPEDAELRAHREARVPQWAREMAERLLAEAEVRDTVCVEVVHLRVRAHPPPRGDPTPRGATDEPDPYVPAPKRRTGNSGHPCLAGERDGDGDGYCGEGR